MRNITDNNVINNGLMRNITDNNVIRYIICGIVINNIDIYWIIFNKYINRIIQILNLDNLINNNRIRSSSWPTQDKINIYNNKN